MKLTNIKRITTALLSAVVMLCSCPIIATAKPPVYKTTETKADNHVLMRRADGRLLGWGDNSSGQLGLGEEAQRKIPSPTEITFFKDKKLKIQQVEVIQDASYVLCDDGSLYSCGKGQDYRTGHVTDGNLKSWTYVEGSREMNINYLVPAPKSMFAMSYENVLYACGD
ncbi:MAG: hypothetical protein RSC41_03050, partial [Oscillospiraceae bacterium]